MLRFEQEKILSMKDCICKLVLFRDLVIDNRVDTFSADKARMPLAQQRRFGGVTWNMKYVTSSLSRFAAIVARKVLNKESDVNRDDYVQ